jgi:hypothetical protein
MNRPKPSKKPVLSWLKILLPLIVSGLTLFSSGSATGQTTASLSPAQTDSIVNAFFLLQFDMKVDAASARAHAKIDSVRIADLEWLTADLRKEAGRQRVRDLITFGVAVAVAGTIYYLGGRAAK